MRASGKQRRLQILEATLRIMRRGGLRAISHRTVAAEASVPLAATTYYFRDLEDLITEAFLHWSQTPQQQVQEFHAAAVAVLTSAPERGATAEDLADRLADVAAAYVVEQVTTHRSDRVLEFAFMHEAARMAKLRTVVRQRQLADREFLVQFHAAVGSQEPAIDAQVSYSLLLGLEKAALLADSEASAIASIRQVLVVYLRRLLAVAPVNMQVAGGPWP
jgi:DNA-binding transcriptional regulator YbjK